MVPTSPVVNRFDPSFHSVGGRGVRELSAMPHGDDPDVAFMHAVEETVGRDDDFSVRQFGELRKNSSGVRMTRKSP